MKALLLPLLGGAAATLTLTAEQIEGTPPAQLARAVFGAGAGGFVEAKATRIPGVAQWQGINVEFASAPRASNKAGLCVFDSANAYFTWSPDDRDGPLSLHQSQRGLGFALLSPAPSLADEPLSEASEAACHRLAPILSEPSHRFDATISGKPASTAEAAFAVAVLVSAKAARTRLTCNKDTGASCSGPFTTWPTIDPRIVYRYEIEHCHDDPATLCVNAWIDRPASNDAVKLRLATRLREPRPDGGGTVSVRSAALSVIVWPVL